MQLIHTSTSDAMACCIFPSTLFFMLLPLSIEHVSLVVAS